MNKTRSLPSHAFIEPKYAEAYARVTEDGTYDLMPAEILWQNRYKVLASKGYYLRPRYRPDWRPSWKGTNLDPMFCEDSVSIMLPHVIDATREEDDFRVSLKVTERDKEIEISRFLTKIDDPDNHCLPLLDVFADPVDPTSTIMVTPYLRPMNDPPFEAIVEVVDFVEQTLKGLAFLHHHRIAHRDIAAANIMMDGSPLYPQGYHPVQTSSTPDILYDAQPLSRADRPVRYFFIDFGISHHFKDDSSPPLLLGRRGRCQQVPELSDTVPYDAFKVDVFALGDVYAKEFTEKFYGVDFLDKLVDATKHKDPTARVTAEGARALWQEIRANLNTASLRWRLRSRDESVPERVVYDTMAIAREGIRHIKRLVR